MKKQTFISVSDLAKAWGVCEATIHRRIAAGDIRAINVAPKGSPVKRWRIPADEANRDGFTTVPKQTKKTAKRG